MVEVKESYITGPFNQVLTTMRQRLSAHRRYGTGFKIGISSLPHQRATNYGSPYTAMIVLYRTTSETFVRDMEKTLVEEYWESCDNNVAGGGGSLGGAPYYLYIVR